MPQDIQRLLVMVDEGKEYFEVIKEKDLNRHHFSWAMDSKRAVDYIQSNKVEFVAFDKKFKEHLDGITLWESHDQAHCICQAKQLFEMLDHLPRELFDELWHLILVTKEGNPYRLDISD